jgi:hypothetical protein
VIPLPTVFGVPHLFREYNVELGQFPNEEFAKLFDRSIEAVRRKRIELGNWLHDTAADRSSPQSISVDRQLPAQAADKFSAVPSNHRFLASIEPAKVATGFELRNYRDGNGLGRIRFLCPLFRRPV